MAEEREFEVIDKRRVSAEGTAAAAAPESPPEDEEPTEAQSQPSSGETRSGEAASAGRGVSAEELRAAAEEAAAQAAEIAGGDMPPLDVPNALSFCVNMLNEVAWVKMGLVPSPMSNKIEKDLAQAKVAIDAVSDLVARLEALVEESMRRDLQVMLSNLRINFVQQSQKP